MSAAVKGSPRSYDNSRRTESSQARQVHVAEVAARLLVERGYAATTMLGLAEAADVSVPWLYKVFGPKPALLKRAYDVLMAGDPDPVPLAQRPAFRALTAETDPRQVIERYAAISRSLGSRAGPLAAALVAAARSGEPELADFVATIDRERLIGAGYIADRLAELDALAPGVSRRSARDVVWMSISSDVYRMLVLERGWSERAYERWLARSLTAALLGPVAAP